MSDLIVTAMLAWYDEDANLLEECVLSLAGLCDRLVAVDGGYGLISDAGGSSSVDQHKTIIRAAKRAGLDLDLFVPPAAWSGQVAKRDWMIKRATHGWQTPPDWLFVVDADYRIHCDRPERVRLELERFSRVDVFEVDFYTPLPDGFDLTQSPHEWHSKLAGKTIRHILLFRAYPEPRLEQRHWYYSALKRGKRVGMLGCHGLYPPAQSQRLRTPLTVEHRCFERSVRTLERNRVYCIDREVYLQAHGVEDGAAA